MLFTGWVLPLQVVCPNSFPGEVHRIVELHYRVPISQHLFVGFGRHIKLPHDGQGLVVFSKISEVRIARLLPVPLIS